MTASADKCLSRVVHGLSLRLFNTFHVRVRIAVVLSQINYHWHCCICPMLIVCFALFSVISFSHFTFLLLPLPTILPSCLLLVFLGMLCLQLWFLPNWCSLFHIFSISLLLMFSFWTPPKLSLSIPFFWLFIYLFIFIFVCHGMSLISLEWAILVKQVVFAWSSRRPIVSPRISMLSQCAWCPRLRSSAAMIWS